MNKKAYFISGIDTDCGKTYITGLLAYHLKKIGREVITTKLVQTGCTGVSDDIMEHRRIMESDLLPEDLSGQTCPFVFSFPASPHLAANIDNKNIDLNQITESTNQLLKQYDIVLTEGAGGLMVPITTDYFTINYIKDNDLNLILVSSSKLGSINHTLINIELCRQYNLNLQAIIFNKFPNHDSIIAEDSYKFLQNYLTKTLPQVSLIHSDTLAKDEKTATFVEKL